ncbi:MAG: non-ribosomal peptide synthetase [Pseudanabaena sp.]|jgi:amino acid adenylation domain-containing protein
MKEIVSQNKGLKSSHSSEIFLPLSEGQKALWLLAQIQPLNKSHNIYSTIQIKSALDVEAWHRVWEQLFDRHSILRTTYKKIEGQVVQQIKAHLDSYIEIIDSEGWSEDKLKSQIFKESDRLFDLEHGPIIRIYLFRCSTDEYIQLITMHHIAGDLWSFDILIQDLQILYAREIYKEFPIESIQKLETLPDCFPYSDYVSWQSNMLNSDRGQESQQYWQKQLSGELPIVNLPFQKQSLAPQTLSNCSYIVDITPNLIESLKRLAEANGVSLDRVMLTVFKILLYRYIGHEDIMVGSPMACRDGQDKFKNIVGFFSNIVVLRTKITKNQTFRELLAQVNQVVSSAQLYQDYPFSNIIQQLHRGDTGDFELLKIAFTWHKQRWDQTQNVLQIKPLQLGHQRGVPFDLTLSIMETEGYFKANWRYNPDLFEAEAIASMAGHFQQLLESILADPDQLISQLPLLTKTEQHKLLVDWNLTQADYPADKCIHHLFEQQVERTPNAIAVVCENQQLTYQALNQRANQLAHHLQSLGADRNMLIGIYMERSIEMVIGILGVLKSGSAYLPLDTNYPQERLMYMLSDSRISLLLTQQNLAKSLAQQQIQIICIEDLQITEERITENVNSNVTAKDLAYVIYTSGSTGKPKGVEIRHQGLVNMMFYRITKLLDREDLIAVPLTSPISFDASVVQLFTPLLAGGKSVIVDNLFSLPRCSQFNQITCIGATPSIIEKFIDEFSLPTSLRTLTIGGEAISQALLEKLMTSTNVLKVINIYGPTEVTVHCTAAVLFDRDKQKIESPHIGCPIANTNVYILDPELQPVPVNIPGELYIGGVGVAKGYLNQPKLTDEKFIVNPFNSQSNSRLYKTGDLACYLPNGNIEFLGRIDSQLKIRGFRIELEEIESALAQYSSIKEVIVTTCTDDTGLKSLCAYFIANQKTRSEEIRVFLAQKIPSYMIPTFFVELEQLYLTPNGKIDRQNLPLPKPSPKASFVSPRNDTERKLVSLWSKLLKIEKISVDDNFLELGGNSLLSANLFAQIYKQFKINLSLSVIFEAPTIEKLAKILQSEVVISSWQPLVPIIPVKDSGTYPPLFCVSGIHGNVILYYKLAKYLGESQPFYGLQPRGLDGIQPPHTSIEAMATSYIQAIRTVQPKGPYFIGGFSFGSKIVWEMAQQLYQQGERVALLALFDGRNVSKDIVRLPFRKRIFLHFQNFREIGFAYISQKLPSWQDWLNVSSQYWTKKTARRFYNRLQLPLPFYLRQFAIEEILEKTAVEAMKNYVIQPYPDKVTLFRADIQDSYVVGIPLLDWDLGWGQLASGGVEIQTVPGDHLTMFREPQIQILAQKLQECLHRARQAQR